MREAPRAGRSPRALTNVATVLLSTVVAVFAAEALARVIGVGDTFGQLFSVRGIPTRTVDGVPLWSHKDPRCDGDDIQRVSADRSAFKIVGLGDSIMYGVSQSKDDTYLEQTRRMLATRSKRSVEILNLAVPGYNTMQEHARFKEVGEQIKPDLVLVHYWEDDAHQYRVVGGYVVDMGDLSDDGRLVVRALPLPPLLNDFLLIHSRWYNLLTHAVLAHNRQPEPYDWTRVSQPLTDIQEREQAMGGRVVILASPELNGVAPQPNADLPLLLQFASTHGIEVIDLSDWLRGVDVKQIAIDGCHFSAEGHRLIGEHLTTYLLQHDLQESN